MQCFCSYSATVRTERNNYKLHVQRRQVTHEAMPVDTDQRLDV